MISIALQVLEGWPCISEMLQWAPGCPVYLMGQYAALQVMDFAAIQCTYSVLLFKSGHCPCPDSEKIYMLLCFFSLLFCVYICTRLTHSFIIHPGWSPCCEPCRRPGGSFTYCQGYHRWTRQGRTQHKIHESGKGTNWRVYFPHAWPHVAMMQRETCFCYFALEIMLTFRFFGKKTSLQVISGWNEATMTMFCHWKRQFLWYLHALHKCAESLSLALFFQTDVVYYCH